MTAAQVVIVMCDIDITGPCVMKRTTPYPTKAKARADAALYGWTTVEAGGYIGDVCPDHSGKGYSVGLREKVKS